MDFNWVFYAVVLFIAVATCFFTFLASHLGPHPTDTGSTSLPTSPTNLS